METNTNANDAYRAARERIDERLNRINRILREHAEEQAVNRGNWGFPGDLGRVVEILDDAIEFLGGTKETP
jgi:hypothetical protein